MTYVTGGHEKKFKEASWRQSDALRIATRSQQFDHMRHVYTEQHCPNIA